MTILAVTFDGGFTRLHQCLDEVLAPIGIPFTTVHDQASGRAMLVELRPKLLLLDVIVPLSPRPASASLVGARVSEAFAETVELSRWVHASLPETRIIALYSARGGLEKAKKAEYLAIASVLDILPYPFSQANQKKFLKLVQKARGALTPGSE